jgi:hypothetical protein
MFGNGVYVRFLLKGIAIGNHTKQSKPKSEIVYDSASIIITSLLVSFNNPPINNWEGRSKFNPHNEVRPHGTPPQPNIVCNETDPNWYDYSNYERKTLHAYIRAAPVGHDFKSVIVGAIAEPYDQPITPTPHRHAQYLSLIPTSSPR